MPMKARLPLLAALLFLMACGSSNTSVTSSWKNKQLLNNKEVSSIFIAAGSPNVDYKSMLEDELAYLVKERGVKPVKSYEVFQGISKDNMPTREAVLDKIRSTKAETILTITLQTVETRENEGVSLTVPQNVSFYGYYSNAFPIVYDPVVHSPDRIYYMESLLFDAATEELLWSAKSETYNPANEENFIKGYTQSVIKRLEKDGIVKKI